MRIPENFEMNMENYNDFYRVDMQHQNPYYSPRLYGTRTDFTSTGRLQVMRGRGYFMNFDDEEPPQAEEPEELRGSQSQEPFEVPLA